MRKWPIAAVVVVLVLGIGVVVVLGQLGRLVQRGVETIGPRLTGTPVQLDRAQVSLFSGEGSLHGLRVANPQGFAAEPAFELGRVAIALDPASITRDVIRVHELVVASPQVRVEFDAQGRSNLKVLLDHVRQTAGGSKSAPAEAGDAAPKLIIEKFLFTGATVRALAPALQLDETLQLPDVRLSNVGAREGGAAVADVAEQILRPIVDSAVRAARDEYLKRQGGKLQDKARQRLEEESRDLLDRLRD